MSTQKNLERDVAIAAPQDAKDSATPASSKSSSSYLIPVASLLLLVLLIVANMNC
jgi:hypothetical protein